MNLSNLVKGMGLRRARTALPWMFSGQSGPTLSRGPFPSAGIAPFLFALLALALGGVLLWSSTVQAQMNATGAPTITGLPRVGEELAADTLAIMDADGITPSNFAYQWVRVDGMTETNIGTDSSTYTLMDADADKQIRVDVTFTDDAGNPEGPLSSELTATVVPADVLVRNTGQQPSANYVRMGPDSGIRAAQAFTTGAYIRYELDSIGFSFHTIADTATAGSELTATLNEDDGGSPGKTLCILVDPPSFASSGTHTFTAPTTGDTPCPQLSANTTYFAVLERANDYTDEIRVNVAQSNNEDAGSLPGWSLDDDGLSYNLIPGGTWLRISNAPRMIEVKGSVSTDTEITVPAVWSLIPSGLTAGDKFRLLFVTSGDYSSAETDIEKYNEYIQNEASLSDIPMDLQAYNSHFRVLGSTADVDARDNTETTSSDTAAAIYWMNGAKVADNYGDFYDGSWDSETWARSNGLLSSSPKNVWTGSQNDGTESFTSGVSNALGASSVRRGILNGTGDPLHSFAEAAGDTYPYYALSGILVVGEAVNNLATGAPAITGTPRVGEILTADTSGIADEDGLGTFAYQWVRFDGTTLANVGTDSSTYTTTNDDAGKRIKVRVSFTDVENNAEGPLSSKLTGVINDSATGVPAISGTPRVGTRLTASTSDIADPGGTDDADYTYQWVRVDGMTEANIGSDSSTYTLAGADADKQIKVKVSFTDDEGEAEGPLESLLTESVVADDVLVQNTAQRLANTIRSLEASVPAEAQQFTTGPHVAGYTLTSIVIDFHTIADTATAGSELTVTLNEESSSDPGDALCTLDDPATFSASGLHTFTAPATGTLCPELAPGTSYLVVITRANNNTDDIFIDVTTSMNIDSGSVTGWSIPNAARSHDGSAWSLDAGVRMMVQVKGAPNTEITVHPDWSLVPTGLSAGDRFRLLFLTNTGHSPTSTEIADYNTYVQGQAAAGHADILDYSSWFRVLGSTATTAARDNTETTSSDTAAAIYWLNGAKVADDYVDFYDQSWDDETNPRGANGAAFTFTLSTNYVWTGSHHDGRRSISGPNVSVGLGTVFVRLGILNDGSSSPLSSTFGVEPNVGDHPYYALSGLFVVSDANATPVFSAETADRTLPENSGAGVNVAGGTITATDRNSGDMLTYSLASSGDHGSFEIDSSTGQLKTKTGVTHSFDFESATKSYSVTVNVSDSRDADGVADTVIDDTIAVTINLTNVDEDGTVTLPATFTGGTEATASVSDSDGTVSSESWRWARGDTATGSFSNISGATSASYEPIALDVGKYLRATVTYTDPEGSGKTASAVSSSTVGGSNAAPTFDDGASTTRSFPENSGTGTNVGGVVAATDGDNDTLTYSMTGNTRFNINTSTGQIKTASGQSWNYEGTRNFQVTVNVRDSKDAAGNADTVVDDSIAVTINLTNVNEAPTITNLLDTPNVPENSSGTILLFASDVDAPTTLSWSVETTDDGSKFQVAGGFLPTLSFKDQPDFETPTDVGMNNTYVVTVRVTDDGSPAMSDTLTFTVTVTNVNEAPVFTSPPATADFAENGTGTVVDFDATDVDASSTLTFSLNPDDDGGKFDIDSTTGALTFKNPPNFEMPTDVGDTAGDNTYAVTVKVTDAGGLSDTHTLIVTVTDVNEAPEITTTVTAVDRTENSVGSITLAASDVDASTTLSWSVESDDDGSKFQISPSTGVSVILNFKGPPDFETPTDVGDTAMNNTYVVKVKVTDDGGLTDEHTVTVTVTNVNEPPVFTSPPPTADFAENGTGTVADFDATDVDALTTLTFSLSSDDDGGKFDIDPSTGVLTFRNPPDFEMPTDGFDTAMNNTYAMYVEVRDNGSPRQEENHLLIVTVTDVNEAPVISGAAHPSFAEIEYDATSPDLTVATYTYTDEDRNPADTITWGLSGADAAHFNISASGVLSFNMPPDFENPFGADNEYLIDVEADDGQGGVGDFPVVVTVTNVDETPEITTTAASHTAPSFMEIEYDATTADLAVADYDGRDEEEQTITWSRTGTDAGDFTIDGSTGVLSFAQRPNYETPADGGGDNVYNVTVRARDTASNTRELEVVVTVTDVNERPDIDEDTVSSYVEIEYDSTGTRPEVHTFTAEDYDAGDTFAWSLLGTDAAHLEIGTATGILTFAQDDSFGQGPLPNFEYPRDDAAGDGSSNTYTITVRATDDDATDQKFTDYAVIVTVTDVNEQPEFTGTPETAITLDEHDANDNYVVMDQADYDAYDEEGGVTWSLTGTDRRDFAISADGVVTFVKTPNYEAPEDSGGNNVYEFNVVATDVQSGSSRRNVSVAVTVTVGDVEEAGTLAVENLSPAAGETVTFRLTDPDGGIVTTSTADITWVIQSLATGGSWTRVSGVLTPASTTFPWVVDEDETGKAIRAMVTYTDRRGSGKTALSQQTAEVTADPIANAPPRFRGGSTWSVEEGPAGGAVGTPTSVTDRDNDTLTYGIQSGGDSALFEINPSTGQVSLAQALDFETTTAPHVLFFYLTLHDGRDADGNAETSPTIDATRSASVFVVDVEEDGVVTLSTDEPVTETQVTATLEDGDGGVIGEIWQWARSENGRTGWTNISGAASSSYTPTVADEDFFLRATVTYTDRRGAGKSAEAVTDDPVPSTNRRPRFPSTETGQRTVPENSRAGANVGTPVAADDPENETLTYTLTGMDADAFTIVERTGQIRVKDDLDFEAPKNSYSVIVEVHDGLDGMGATSTTIDDTQAVTIMVENAEEPGVVTITTDAETVLARVEVTATLEDDDIPSGVTWQWSRSPNGRTDWVNIQGATLAAYTPTLEEDRGNYIRATASYSDDEGSNKTASAVSARVGDPPPVNSEPVFPSTENGRREVAENSDPGSPIGDPVAATDLNVGDSNVNDPLAYSLSGTDAASFTIDAGTGQIRLAQDATLDYEGKRTYRVTVEVTDGRDQNGDDDMDAIDDRQNVVITVTNVNEAPVITGDTAPSVKENTSSMVASYTATDPERDTLTWSVSPLNRLTAWISDQGQLYLLQPVSFESQTRYGVVVIATDDDVDNPLSHEVLVTITVENVEEPGVVTISPPRGWVDVTTQFSAALSDDDGAISGTTWQWERSPNGRSSWTDIASATLDSYTVTADDANQYLRATASYTDGQGSGKTASATLRAPVGDAIPVTNTAPAFSEATTTRTVSAGATRATGATPGRNVGARVTATDSDQGDVLTYSLLGGAFDIDPATGQIRTRAVLVHDPDPDGNNTYEVTVSVHDGFDASYNESSASDATIDVTITVTASRGGGGGGGGGPSNLAPVFADGPSTDREVAENAAAGADIGEPVAATDTDTLTHTLGGADAGYFAIVAATGQIQVGDGTVLDHEAEKNTYVVEVTATDPSGATAMIAVTIAVTNQPEVGTVTLSPAAPVVDAELRAALSDPDGGVTGVTWQWARSADPDGWTDIPGATSMGYTPTSVDLGHHLRATASYTDALAPGQTAVAVTGQAVTEGDPLVARYDANGNGTIERGEVIAAINDYLFGEGAGAISRAEVIRLINLYLFGGGGTPSNQPPVFADGPSTEREVAENTAAGADIGEPVAATDTDILTHSLGGADAGYFAIVAATGQIQVGDGTVLDHEAEKNTYFVEVTATDPSGATAMIAVTIAVTNQPEVGTVTLSPAAPVVDAELRAALDDPDGGVTGVTWQWARSEDMNGWTDIPGATSTGYTPASVDLGHHLRATATYTDALASGQTAVGVTGQAVTEGDPLVARYDANGNGMIERGEVIAAINDYLFGEGAGAISRAEVIRLINLYLFG